MTSIYKLLSQNSILLPKLAQLELKNFSKKRTLKAYLGVDMKDYYTLIFLRTANGRLLQKEASELEQISSKIQLEKGYSIKKHILFYSSQACSKALAKLKQEGYKTIKVEL